MFGAALVVLIVMLLLGGAALGAFWWAMSDGQFEDPEEAARSIFTPEEPVGVPTDPALREREE